MYFTAPDSVAMTRGFWCSSDNISLEAHGHAKITINFVPFQLGTRQCSVLLINEDIGEFLYLIETETTLPLPSRVPYVPSAHSVRVSSSMAALHGRGVFGGDDRVLYWKCDNNESFTENILIPAINVAKESALGGYQVCLENVKQIVVDLSFLRHFSCNWSTEYVS